MPALLPPDGGNPGFQPAEDAQGFCRYPDVLHRYAGHHRLRSVGYRPRQAGADLCTGHGRRGCTGAQPVPERHPHAGGGAVRSAAGRGHPAGRHRPPLRYAGGRHRSGRQGQGHRHPDGLRRKLRRSSPQARLHPGLRSDRPESPRRKGVPHPAQPRLFTAQRL